MDLRRLQMPVESTMVNMLKKDLSGSCVRCMVNVRTMDDTNNVKCILSFLETTAVHGTALLGWWQRSCVR